MEDIRVAAISMESVPGDKDRNLEKMSVYLEEAGRGDVKIACFPELNITGYFYDDRARRLAEKIPGRTTDAVENMSKSSGVAVLAGMIEVDGKGKIYITQVFVKPDGLAGAYRKIYTGNIEKSVYSAGDSVEVFEYLGCTLGVGLCYDIHFPEICTIMAAKGAEIIFFPQASPTGDPRTKLMQWLKCLPARAYDNSAFIVACNQTGRGGDGLDFPGVGLFISPDGEVIKSWTGLGEKMLIAHLDSRGINEIRKDKKRFFLSNRRKEIYKLLCES